MRQRDDGVARDAVQHRRQRRRADLAVAHHEEILAAGLGDEPLRVEQDRLVVAVEQRLALGEDRVDVVAAGLALGHLGVDVVAREGRDLGADAALHALVAEILAPRPGRDRDADRVVARIETHRAVADVDERPDVALAHLVRAQRREDRRLDLRLRERHLIRLMCADSKSRRTCSPSRNTAERSSAVR